MTVLKAVTEPSPVRYTGISPCCAATITTGTAGAAGRAAGSAAGVSRFPEFFHSQYPPPRRASTSSQIHQRLFASGRCTRCSKDCRRSASCGFTVVGVSPFILTPFYPLTTGPSFQKSRHERLTQFPLEDRQYLCRGVGQPGRALEVPRRNERRRAGAGLPRTGPALNQGHAAHGARPPPPAAPGGRKSQIVNFSLRGRRGRRAAGPPPPGHSRSCAFPREAVGGVPLLKSVHVGDDLTEGGLQGLPLRYAEPPHGGFAHGRG